MRPADEIISKVVSEFSGGTIMSLYEKIVNEARKDATINSNNTMQQEENKGLFRISFGFEKLIEYLKDSHNLEMAKTLEELPEDCKYLHSFKEVDEFKRNGGTLNDVKTMAFQIEIAMPFKDEAMAERISNYLNQD